MIAVKHTEILSTLRLAILATVVLLMCTTREAVRLAPVQRPARDVTAQSLRRAPSPARTSVHNARKLSGFLLTRAPASFRVHATSVHRKTPVASSIHCPTAAVMRAELSFRCNLIIARSGQSASLTNAVPPPLS